MKTLLLYISTLLNAILIVAVFFKSSINEIFVEYFKDRLDLRKKRRDATNLAYSLVKKLRTTTFIVLVQEAQTVITGKSSISQRKDYLKEFGDYNDQIEAVELFLPPKAIAEYNRFRDMVKKYGSEISREGTTKERLFEIGKNLENQIDRLKGKLARGFK